MEENKQPKNQSPVQSSPSGDTPSVPNTEPISKPKPKFKLPILIAGIVLILLLIMCYSVLILPKQKTSQQLNQIVNTSPTPNANQVATANWKTYTNSKYGFSIKEAQGMKESFEYNVFPGTDSFSFQNGEEAETGFVGQSLGMLVIKEENYNGNVPGGTLISDYKIDGTSVKRAFSNAGDQIGPLMHNGYVYVFNVDLYSSSKIHKFSDVYAMLSTFKFTK